jgi:hypothetical protein
MNSEEHVDELRHRVGGVGLGADLVGDEALRVGIAGLLRRAEAQRGGQGASQGGGGGFFSSIFGGGSRPEPQQLLIASSCT